MTWETFIAHEMLRVMIAVVTLLIYWRLRPEQPRPPPIERPRSIFLRDGTEMIIRDDE